VHEKKKECSKESMNYVKEKGILQRRRTVKNEEGIM
jgi:hypothetical protein